MKTLDLAYNANWQIWGADPADTTPGSLSPPDLNTPDWLAANIPGDINADLLRHGRIPDPHHDDNARGCYWVTAKDWWYHAAFDAPDAGAAAATMVFEVLDGTADVFLNDVFLGTADNAFHPWDFNVTKVLKQKDNQLLLRFRSIDRFFGSPRQDDRVGWPGKRQFLRKPQFSFGWDWALPLPSLGIGGAVRLEFDNALCLTACSVQPFIAGRVDFNFEVSPTTRRAGYELEITLTGHGTNLTHRLSRLIGKNYSGHGADGAEAPAAPFKSYCSLRIPEPQLWYPNGFGAQPLYHYAVRLFVAGREVDTRHGRLGLRETRIVEEPFTPSYGDGMSFHIAVNGQNIFCKGSNWVPPELWPATVTEGQYRFYLRQARDAGFNMLRVWGGGVYEREFFYDLCDEYGILLRGLVGRLGLDVPYVESSPASRDDCGNMPWSGNCHISAWKYALFQADGHPENFRKHFEQVCAFNSEFCDQGPCSVESFKHFLAPPNRWPPNDVWVFHIQRGHKNLPHHEQTLTIAGGIFGPINSLEDYVKFGQATHLEMTRCEFEAARRDRPNCGGTMSWMLNDCWPTANWSIIDYYRTPKPAYYASRRACAPILPIILTRGDNLEFFVDNQTPRPCHTSVVYGVETLVGRRLWEKRQNINIPANQNIMIDRIPESARPVPLNAYWFIDAEINGKALPRQCYFPHGWKDVPWPTPTITTQYPIVNAPQPADICVFSGAGLPPGRSDRDGAGLPPGRSDRGEGTPAPEIHTKTQWIMKILITTDVFARLCHVYAMGDANRVTPLAGVEYSDNYFDLPAGTSRLVKITAPSEIPMENIHIGHWLGTWI